MFVDVHLFIDFLFVLFSMNTVLKMIRKKNQNGLADVMPWLFFEYEDRI